jgi:serine/threonine protein kinase
MVGGHFMASFYHKLFTVIDKEYLSMFFNHRSASFKEFIKKCLEKNPTDRPSSQELLSVSISCML